jgi:hypothetical protein
MNFNIIFKLNRFQNILFKPSQEWMNIKNENHSNKNIFLTFLLPFGFVIFASCFFGYSRIFSLPIDIFPFYFVISASFITALTSILGIYLASYIITKIAQYFSSIVDINSTLILIAYSSILSLVLSVLTGLFPEIKNISLVGLYSIYIMWYGLEIMLETPKEKKINFLILSTIIMILSYIVVALILSLTLSPVFWNTLRTVLTN